MYLSATLNATKHAMSNAPFEKLLDRAHALGVLIIANSLASSLIFRCRYIFGTLSKANHEDQIEEKEISETYLSESSGMRRTHFAPYRSSGQ